MQKHLETKRMKTILFLFLILCGGLTSCIKSKQSGVAAMKEKSFVELLDEMERIFTDTLNPITHNELQSMEQFVDTLMLWRNTCHNKDSIRLAQMLTGYISAMILDKGIEPADEQLMATIEQNMEELNYRFDELEERDGTLTFDLMANFARHEEDGILGRDLEIIIDIDKQTGVCQGIYLLPSMLFETSKLLAAEISFYIAQEKQEYSIQPADFMANRENGWMLRCDGKHFEKLLHANRMIVTCKCDEEIYKCVVRLEWLQKQYDNHF